MKKIAIMTTMALVLLFAQVSSAKNPDKEAAAAHFKNGLSLLKAKNYKGAVTEFEASIELFESKSALFNLANCYEALHRYREAIDTFSRLEQTFAGSLSADMKDSVKRHRERLLGLVGKLIITVDIPGAQIAVDGRVFGKSPLSGSLLFGPGEYEVVVTLDGFETFKQSVRLTSGRRLDLEVALEPGKGRVFVTVDNPGATIYLDGEAAGTTPLAAPLEPGHGKHVLLISKPGYKPIKKEISVNSSDSVTLEFTLVASRGSKAGGLDGQKPSFLFWTGVGLTVASIAVAGVFGGLAAGNEDDYNHYNDLIAINPETHVDASSWLKNRGNADSDFSRNRGLAWGFGIGAGVFAVASGVIFFVERRDKGEKKAARIIPGRLSVSF